EAQQPRLVLALEGDEMAAGIEHGDGERRTVGVAAFLERGVDDRRGLSERDGHVGSLVWITAGRASPNRPARPRLPPDRTLCSAPPRSRRWSSPRAAARGLAPGRWPAWCADPSPRYRCRMLRGRRRRP